MSCVNVGRTCSCPLPSRHSSCSFQCMNIAKTLHVVKRDGSGAIKSIPMPFDGAIEADLQFINAYDTDDGKVVMDAIQTDSRNVVTKPTKWPWATTMEDFASHTGKRKLVRYVVEPSKGSVSKEVLADTQCYFATINPAASTKQHRYIYCAVGSMDDKVCPPQGITRMDVLTGETQSWMPKDYEFCGEPMFVEKKSMSSETGDGEAPADTATSEEDNGYILSVLYDGREEESQLLVLDATNVGAGPIVRVPLGIAVPHGLHGCFAPNETTGFEEIDRRAKLSDKMESRGNMWNEVKSDFSGLGLRLDDLEEYFGDIM